MENFRKIFEAKDKKLVKIKKDLDKLGYETKWMNDDFLSAVPPFNTENDEYGFDTLEIGIPYGEDYVVATIVDDDGGGEDLKCKDAKCIDKEMKKRYLK